jgi:spore photoproduct lyase
VAFSFTPQAISSSTEHLVPPIEKRLAALDKLQKQGWLIGLRFDPLIWCDNFYAQYQELFEQVFSVVSVEQLHSVSFGLFRMPSAFYERMVQLYPLEKLFAFNMEKRQGMTSYSEALETQMRQSCQRLLLEHVPEEKLFPCTD